MNQKRTAAITVSKSLFGLKLKSWVKTVIRLLYPYRPRFGTMPFWIVQVMVIGIAAIHDIIEIGGYLPRLGMLYFVPASLFFVPVVYAALNFGSHGSISTAFWVVIITIPNWVFWHHGLERWGVIFQMFVLVSVALFVGHRVDREREARKRAQAYAAHIVRGQEEERQRIARDLHDDTIQSLILVCRQLDSVKDISTDLSSQASNSLQTARSNVEQIVTGLRNFARALRPPILDDLGIVASIRRMLMEFKERTKIDGQFKVVGGKCRLSPDIEVGMFRIAQEALWNVERHSKANRVIVTVELTDNQAVLDVMDNGIGFIVPTNMDQFAANGKLGFIGMRERVELLGGKLEVYSIPGKGTRITASIPLGAVISGS